MLNEAQFLPVRFSQAKSLQLSHKIRKGKEAKNSQSFSLLESEENFVSLLSKVFLCQPILKQELKINQLELSILLEIILRISKINQESSEALGNTQEFLYKQIKVIQAQQSLKRNEENMKFIFKFVMKKIQDSLNLPPLQFYMHFF